MAEIRKLRVLKAQLRGVRRELAEARLKLIVLQAEEGRLMVEIANIEGQRVLQGRKVC